MNPTPREDGTAPAVAPPVFAAGEAQTRSPDGLSRTRRLLVLGICAMSLLIVGLDITIVNVALPSIHRELKASVSGLQWTIDAYTLVIASLLMLAGSTADRIGRRRTFQIGLVVFSFGSLLCGSAPSLGLLVAARVLQAIGGSMLNPVAMSIVRNVFTDPRERAQAIGAWGAVFGLSMALGPIVGGALVDALSWRAVFFVNVPIGVAAIVLTALYVPESRAERPRRFDPMGQLLVLVGLGSLTFAIIEGPRAGWTSAQTLVLFGLGLGSLAALVPYELRHREPLLEMRFFRSVPLSGASTIAVLYFAAFGGFLFLNTLYLQTVRGLSPLDAGLYLLPLAAMIVVCGPISGRLVASHGPRLPMVIAAIAMLAGAVMLTDLSRRTAMAYLLCSYFLFGIGEGLMNPPITNTAVAGMPATQAGVASAVASTSRQVGMTLGVAIIGAVAGRSLTDGIGESFASATHLGWWIIVGLGVLLLALAVASTGKWANSTALRTAARFNENGTLRADSPRFISEASEVHRRSG
jgi:EmrB/QacA subfamily drug resistance transporter